MISSEVLVPNAFHLDDYNSLLTGFPASTLAPKTHSSHRHSNNLLENTLKPFNDSILHLESNHIFLSKPSKDTLKWPLPTFLTTFTIQCSSSAKVILSVLATSMILSHIRFPMSGALFPLLINRLAPAHLLDLNILELKKVSQEYYSRTLFISFIQYHIT